MGSLARRAPQEDVARAALSLCTPAKTRSCRPVSIGVMLIDLTPGGTSCAFPAVLAQPRPRRCMALNRCSSRQHDRVAPKLHLRGDSKTCEGTVDAVLLAEEAGHDVVLRIRRVVGRCSGGGLSTLNARHSSRGPGRQHAVLHTLSGSWTRGPGTRLRCGPASNQQRWARACVSRHGRGRDDHRPRGTPLPRLLHTVP